MTDEERDEAMRRAADATEVVREAHAESARLRGYAAGWLYIVEDALERPADAQERALRLLRDQMRRALAGQQALIAEAAGRLAEAQNDACVVCGCRYAGPRCPMCVEAVEIGPDEPWREAPRCDACPATLSTGKQETTMITYPGQIIRNRKTGAIQRIVSLDGGLARIDCAEVPGPKEAPSGWMSLLQLQADFLPFAVNGMPLDEWKTSDAG